MPRPNKGPYLAVNKSGVYEIRYTESGRSKRRSTQTKDSRTAQKELALFLATDPDSNRGDKALTVAQALALYTKQHADRKNTKASQDRLSVCAANVVRGLGHVPVDGLTDKQIAAYTNGRGRGKYNTTGKEVKPGTVRRELAILIASINYLVKTKRLSADSAPWIQLPNAGAARDFFLYEFETDALLQFGIADNTPDGRMTRAARFVVVALASAARRRSIETLRWDQVDLEKKQFRFTPSGTTKRRVPVPIPNWAMPILRMMEREKTGAFVLDDDRPIRPAFEWFMKRATNALGNQRFLQLTRHGLRHTAATQMARSGANLFELAGILGDSLATVERNYLHHCPDHLREAANRVDRHVTFIDYTETGENP